MNLTDYMGTHNILSAVDILISNVSTILLEAAMHGKPILCMVSDEDIEQIGFLRVTMNSLYFQELLEKLNVPRCNDFKELPGMCNDLLEKASSISFSEKFREKVRFFVDQGSEPYPVQLRKFIQEILSA